MADKKDYINLSVDELEKYIKKEFKDYLFSYPINMMEARAGIYLSTLEDGSLYLDTLNIVPGGQGKGIGSQILEILKNWAIANNKAVYIKPAYLPDNPTFKNIEVTPEQQLDNLFNFYKNNGWVDNPNFTAMSKEEQAAQLSLSANAEWGASTDDIYSPLVFLPEGVDVPDLPKNPYLDDIISFTEKFNKDGKAFLEGYNQPIVDEVLTEFLKLEMYYGVEGYMEVSDWEESKFHDVALQLDSEGIYPNDVDDIGKYIPRDKILTPAEIFKEGKRNEFFTDAIVDVFAKTSGSFYIIDYIEDAEGNEIDVERFPENRPKRNLELYHAISGKDEAEVAERVSEYTKKHTGTITGKPKEINWVKYVSEGDKSVPSLDTPTNVVDDIPDNIQKLIDEGKVIKTKTANSTFKTLNRDTLLIDDINISTKTYQELMDFADKNNFTLVVALERITEDSGALTSQSGPLDNDELYRFWTRNGNEYFNWDLTYDNKKGIEKLWNDDKYILEFYEPNQQAVIKFQDEIRNKYPELEQNRKAFKLEMYPYKTYDTNGNPVLMLREINVKPEFQGKGIGTKIMNELTEFADELNIPILLSTSPTGKETLPEFYNKFGFLETGETGKNFDNEKFMIRQPNELAGKVGRIGETPGTQYKSYEEALEAVKNIDTPTNVVQEGPALLETRMSFGNDRVSPEWKKGIVDSTSFNPDTMTRLTSEAGVDKYVFTDMGREIYNRILAGTATDEDLTRFFIYLAEHSGAKVYAYKQFNQEDAIADIVKIGIFSDMPIGQIIPINLPWLEKDFLDKLYSRNSELPNSGLIEILVQMVKGEGQFANLKEKMRKVIFDAHLKNYSINPNDYFILWRGGDLSRFNTWQSFTKRGRAAVDVMYQMVPLYGGGRSVSSYIIHKNNFIDLDALGLSFRTEKEIIALTEAANMPGAKRPTKMFEPGELQNIKDWWLVAKDEPGMFPKAGFVIENISTQLNQLGQSTQDFFTEVLEGMNPKHRPSKPYEQLIPFSNESLQGTQDVFNNYVIGGGEFNQHIFTSIPTFYETQIVKAEALHNLLQKYPKNGSIRILDIGGTEGTWAKTLGFKSDNYFVEVLDPNPSAKKIFDKELVYNVLFTQEAFSYNPADQGKFFDEQKQIKFHTFLPDEPMKYDVVHESMAFQFIDSNRREQIKFIKENVLSENGILIIEEKFKNNDAIYKMNEEAKNEFKSQYYTEEQLRTKEHQVLTGMGDNQISVQEMEDILTDEFKYVEQYWDSGNFKGYIVSNNPIVQEFVPEINKLDVSLTSHLYSTAPTEPEIKAAIQKQLTNKGVSSEIAKEMVEEFGKSNSGFIDNAVNAVSDLFKNVKSVSKLGTAKLLAAGGKALQLVSKAEPLYATGDVLIEKTLGKVTPYLRQGANKLGFGFLPVESLVSTYIATEIGIALADLVQAGMYAYETTAKQTQPSEFQETLTRVLLPKSYEEEAIQRQRQDTAYLNDLFFNTPTGKEVLKTMDFGSNFMKELEKEKISKYSPGWALTKGIWGTMYDLYKEGQTSGSMYNTGYIGSYSR